MKWHETMLPMMLDITAAEWREDKKGRPYAFYRTGPNYHGSPAPLTHYYHFKSMVVYHNKPDCWTILANIATIIRGDGEEYQRPSENAVYVIKRYWADDDKPMNLNFEWAYENLLLPGDVATYVLLKSVKGKLTKIDFADISPSIPKRFNFLWETVDTPLLPVTAQQRSTPQMVTIDY